MNLHGFQIKKALVIFILIIAAGMAIQYFLYQSRVINPLGWELAGLPGVLKAEVVQKGLSSRAPSTVHLTLAEDVPLSLTFQGIWRALEEAGGEFIIELEDSADPALLNLFPKVQLLIEEAVMTGEFTLLEKRVHQLAQSYNSLGDVTLDRNYVYLRLQNERGMLQRVISRGREEGRIKIGAGRVATDAEVG